LLAKLLRIFFLTLGGILLPLFSELKGSSYDLMLKFPKKHNLEIISTNRIIKEVVSMDEIAQSGFYEPKREEENEGICF
jgi:hypothetical protein